MNNELASERKSLTLSVAVTLVFIPCLIGLYTQGPEQVALVSSVAFMVGYIVDRVRLHRRIVDLLTPDINA